MTDTRVDPSTGELVGGRYLLLERIGRGGSAEVFRARDTRVPREVAVKLVRDWSANAEAGRRLRSEATLLAGLAHPALVTLHDAGLGEDGEAPYLIMELVDGADLSRTAASLSTSEIASVVADVARALAHAHSRGIVHRDVKPGNVLVVRDEQGPRGKLADLGIAHLTGATRATAKGTIVGTVAYLSPEQARGEEVTPATDVYSLALLLIEALTGQRAFLGTEGETFAARLSRPPRMPVGLLPADRALLDAMTSRDARSRPDAATVAAALGSWASSPVRPGPAAAGMDADGRAARTPATQTESTELGTEIGDAPTRVLVTGLPDPGAGRSASGGSVAAPRSVSATADTEQGEDRSSRSGPGRLLLSPVATAVALGLAVIALVAAVTIGLGSAAEREPAVDYPSIDGELGDAYRNLQELIEP